MTITLINLIFKNIFTKIQCRCVRGGDFKVRKIIYILVILVLSKGLVNGAGLNDYKYIGAKEAPVVIYEFVSLACVHCATLSEEVMALVKKDYIDKGLVKLVFVDVPFGGQTNLLAHTLLYKTKTDSEFFKLASLYLANQSKWMSNGSTKEVEVFARLAGIKEAEITEAKSNKKFQDNLIEQAKSYLGSLEIDGTPTVFIVKSNENVTKSSPRFSGVPKYSAIKREIETALGNK